MDLDNMKQAWQSLSTAGLRNEVSQSQIAKMIRKKSKSQLNKLILTFVIECLVNLLVIAYFVWYAHQEFATSSQWIYDIFIVVMLICYILPILKLFKLGKFSDQPTINYLDKLISTFDRVFKTIRTVYKVCLLVAFPIGVLMGFANADFKMDGHGVMVFVVMLLIYIPFYLGIVHFIKWYYNYFYMRRINKMRTYAQELKVDVGDVVDVDDVVLVEDAKPVKKSRLASFSKGMAIFIGLLVLVGLILNWCGCEQSIFYYIGYGIGYSIRSVQDWFIS